jgi:murein DD-endopeptidase MepM/ murein hydrolase activator NlpD
MPIRTPLIHWLSMRLRIVLGAAFLVGALLPPYVPSSASEPEEDVVPEQQFLFVEEGFLMKASTIGEQGSRLAFSEGLVHTVRSGESLAELAAKYKVSPDTIRWANGLGASATLTPNEELIILPVDGVLHAVRRGETVGEIAALYEIPQESIVAQNRIKGSFIVPGEQLIIPGGKPVVESTSPIAAVDEALRFTDRLPSRTISLKVPGGGTVNVPRSPGTAGAAAALTTASLQHPCGPSCLQTQGYGPGHYALDLQVRGGGPIYAAEGGTVIRASYGYNGGYGNVIEVDHGKGLVTLYAHNKELYVKEGDSVTRGQQISFMGNTGRVHGKTGIHVHFEVRVNGVKKNPRLYLD